MQTSLLKIILLASVADGEIQPPELALMNQIKDFHPELKQVSEKEIQEASVDIYNKLSAGMDFEHIIAQLAKDMTQEQKEIAYALSVEVCAADFGISLGENDFLQELAKQFSISSDVKSVVKKSIKLRYSID